MNIKFTIVIVNISILSPSPTEYYNNNLVDDNVEFYCAEYYGVKVFAGWVYCHGNNKEQLGMSV